MAKRKASVPETGDLFAPRSVEPGPVDAIPEPVAAAPSQAELEPELEASAPEASELRASEREESELEPSAALQDEPRTEPRAPLAPASLYFDEPFRELEHNGGIHLTDSILWCDADRRHDLTFISHAHADFIGKSRRIFATDKTVRILTRGTGKIDALTSPYRRSFTIGLLQLEMHPAGHVLGSAQLLITRNDRRIVYTSDVNPRSVATVDRAVPVPCDVLAIPATYGIPMYKFPPREEVLEGIKKFIDDALSDRATPVLIANQIGTSQELMHVLGKSGYRLRVHRSIYDIGKIYRELGVAMPGSRRFQGSPAKDEVVIFPPILRKHASIRKLRKFRTALITGRAMDQEIVYRHRVEAAFPLSDTADHDDLLAFIKATGAQEVYLTSGYIEELSAELRDLGIKVYSVVPPKQLSLF